MSTANEKNQFYDRKFKIEGRITFSTFFCNILLAIGKLFGGIFGKSQALISDAINSFGDIVTSVITFVGTKLGGKKPDSDHQYGHQRIQSISIVIFEMIVIFSGLLIIYEGITGLINIVGSNGEGYEAPTLVALIISIVVICIKLTLFIICKIFQKQTKSNILKAASYDHLFDSIGTILSLIGIVFAIYLKIYWIDYVMSIVVAILLIYVAIKMMIENINALVDKAWDSDKISAIKKLIKKEYPQVISIDKLRSRVFAERVYIDLEIGLNANMSIKDGHDIAASIEKKIENTFFEVIHVNIHINPKE